MQQRNKDRRGKQKYDDGLRGFTGRWRGGEENLGREAFVGWAPGSKLGERRRDLGASFCVGVRSQLTRSLLPLSRANLCCKVPTLVPWKPAVGQYLTAWYWAWLAEVN